MPATFPSARGRVPLLGHTLALARGPLKFFQALQTQGDIVQVDLGPVRTLFLTEPSLIQALLLDRTNVLDKGRFYDKVRPLAGNGVVLAQGAEHKRQLAMIKPAFHREQLVGYTDVMRGVVVAKAESWQEGQRIDADKEMHAITLRILSSTMFGAGVQSEAISELVRLLPGVLKGIMVRTILPDFVDKLPLPMNRRFDRAFAELRGTINKVMRHYREADIDSGDLMSLMLQARDEQTGEPLTEQQVCDQIVAVTMAGSETAATALAWMFHEMAQHPKVERQVREEVRDVLGDRPIEIGDVPKLEYTRRVLQEVLRMRQPIMVISRRATQELDLGGVRIPEGSELFCCPFAVSRDARFFPDPLRFDPDRWLATPVADLPRGVYFPFGGGPRHCIGEQFAWVMMTVAVAEVVRRWQLTSVPGVQVREMPWATINPSSLPMTVAAPR
jgi:cytochrome P450